MHDSTTFLKSVAWNIDNKEPWRSYIVQELNLSIDPSKPVSAILLDTTQFVSKPNLILPNAGLNGDIQSEQLEIIEGWLKDDPTGQKITIFMSHHPFDRLLPKAGDAVDSLRKKYRIPLYISAHTHAGQYIARGGSEGWLELNVGSIVDWPMEFRTFSIHEVRDDPEKFVFRAKLFRIPECWDRLIPPQSPQCDFSWEAKPEDPDYYLSHGDSSSLDPKKTQEDLMNCILHVYIRLFTNVPSAENNNVWPEGCSSNEEVLKKIEDAKKYSLTEKKTFLKALGEYDRKREPCDKTKLRDYRLWQAVWASKYDKSGARIPEASDSYIIFPRR